MEINAISLIKQFIMENINLKLNLVLMKWKPLIQKKIFFMFPQNLQL